MMKTRPFALLFFAARLAFAAGWGVVAREPDKESGITQGASPALRLNISSTDSTIDPATQSEWAFRLY